MTAVFNTRSSTPLAPASASPRSVDQPSDDDSARITIVLGCFDVLVGRGLRQILGEDQSLRIIGADLDPAALEHAVASRAPQVAILDEVTVVETSVLERLRAARPAIGIVVLAHLPTVAYGMRLLAGGASCVAKEASAANILATVHTAADGRRVFADVDGHLVERSIPATMASLTPREMEVLEYLSRGRTHGEVAHALQLGIETIRTHSAHLRSKLGVRSNRDFIGLPIPDNAERGTKSHGQTSDSDIP